MFLLKTVTARVLLFSSNIFIVVWYESLPLVAWPHWYDEPDHSQFCTSVVAFKVTPPSKDVLEQFYYLGINDAQSYFNKKSGGFYAPTRVKT